MKVLLREQKGSVSTAFLLYMGIFLFLFILIVNLGKVWTSHSHSQASADAGSLAASRKVNEIMKREVRPDVVLEDRIERRTAYYMSKGIKYPAARWLAVEDEIKRGSIRNQVFLGQYGSIELPYLLHEVYYHNESALGAAAYTILSRNQREIASYVRQYVEMNGSDPSGRIQIPYTNKGRIRVITETDLKPVWLSGLKIPEFESVEGDGAGPDVGYLYKMPKLEIYF